MTTASNQLTTNIQLEKKRRRKNKKKKEETEGPVRTFSAKSQRSCECYRDVTLSMPILRSSSVQAVRTVVISMLPLVHIFPEVFRRWRANSPSLRFSSCGWSGGCRTGTTVSHKD